MTNYTLQELTEIGKHLEKVREIQSQNVYANVIEIDIPDEIELKRVSNGLKLGIVLYDEELEDYVFAPHFEKEPEPPKWQNTIPMPNF